MKPIRSNVRRALDRRLNGLDQAIGTRPHHGWIRAVRDALGMSAFELAGRLGVTQPRVVQLEREEVTGSIRLSTLERVAEALDCSLCYVLVPREPLEEMVRRQAREKATAERVLVVADDLVDRRGLWTIATSDTDRRLPMR